MMGLEWNSFGVGPVEALIGLLFFVIKLIFIGAAVMFVVNLLRRSDDHSTENSAVQVLEERYARGEISREEFVERRAVLRGGG